MWNVHRAGVRRHWFFCKLTFKAANKSLFSKHRRKVLFEITPSYRFIHYSLFRLSFVVSAAPPVGPLSDSLFGFRRCIGVEGRGGGVRASDGTNSCKYIISYAFRERIYAGEWLTPPPSSSPRCSRGTTQTRNLLTRRRRNIYLHFCFWYRCRSVRFPGENIRVRDSSEGRNPEKRRLSGANSISQTLRSRTVQTTRKWFSGRWFHRDPLLRCYKIVETRQKWLVFFILDSFVFFKTLR